MFTCLQLSFFLIIIFILKKVKYEKIEVIRQNNFENQLCHHCMIRVLDLEVSHASVCRHKK